MCLGHRIHQEISADTRLWQSRSELQHWTNVSSDGSYSQGDPLLQASAGTWRAHSATNLSRDRKKKSTAGEALQHETSGRSQPGADIRIKRKSRIGQRSNGELLRFLSWWLLGIVGIKNLREIGAHHQYMLPLREDSIACIGSFIQWLAPPA